MIRKDDQPGDAAELRRRAEEMERGKATPSTENIEALTPEEIRRTLHELRVHQIELEMQNEELRLAQVEPDAARARYFDLYDLAPVGYCTVSEQGLILEANLTAASLLGVGRGTLVGQRLTSFILPEDEDIYYLHRKELFETGAPQACELRMMKGDGTAFWAHLDASAAEDAGGEPVCRVVMSDNPERKRAGEALRKSESLYRELFESSSDALFLIDTYTGQIVEANNMASAIYGYDPDELLTKKATDMSAEPEDTHQRIQETQTKPGQAFRIPLRLHRKKDGTVFPVEITARPFIRQEQVLLLVSSRDITDRMRAEEALRESEERHRSILSTAIDGFWLVDSQWRLLEVNETYCRMSGYSAPELLAMRIPDLEAAETDTDTAAHIQRIMAQGQQRFESRHRRKDGSIFEVEVSVQYRPTAGGQFVAFLRDITERKRMAAIQTFLAQTRSGTGDEPFFQSLARYLAESLRMDFVCIDRLEEDELTARTVAVWCDGHFEDNVTYALKDTPCGDVVGRTVCCFPASVRQCFPRDQVLQDLRAESYLGVTLWSHDGKPIGLIAVIGRCPLANRSQAEATLQLVGERAAGELERLNAEEALRESGARYRSLFEQSGDLILLLELRDGLPLILDANQAALRAHGYSRAEMVGQPISLIEPDITLELVAERTSLMAAGKPLYMRRRRKDGSTFEVESVARQARIGAQDVGLAVERDVTERKRVETELRVSRQRLALHVQQTPLAVIEFGVDGRVTQWNPGAVAVFGFSREEAVGQPWTFLVPQYAWGTLDGLFEALVTQHGGSRSTNENVTKDGRTLSCEWFNTPLTDRDGSVIGAASLVIDITERKQAEDALRASEERFRMVATNTPDHILVQDRDLRYVWVSNPQLGLTVEGMLGRTDFDILPEEDAARITAIKRGVLETGQPVRVSLPLTSIQGDIQYFEGAYTPRRDSAGDIDGLIGYFRNVTEHKRAEEEREHLQLQLAQAQKMESIGRLAGGVAHDFNNLLTVINGYSQMLLDKLSADDPMRANLAEIHKAGDRAAGLTRQLLAFSRKQVLEPRVLDLNQVVEEMRPMLERLVGEDVELRVALSAEAGMVHADPHQLEQVLMNVVVNARDAMPGSGKLLIETACVDWDASYAQSHPEARVGRYVMLAVSDNGVGMDEPTWRQIFEPFFTTKGAGQGTGLGLSMVQGIVAQSGGYINVYSEPGQGATFNIYLPRVTEAVTDEGMPEAVPALGGVETVMVVEDQAEVREFVAAALMAYGYRVIKAEDTFEAILLCEHDGERIDLVLTDVVMPNVGGWDLASRLEKLRPGIKVLFMSGYSDDLIEHHGVSPEGAGFIQKPFSPAQLAGKVRAVLGPRAPTARIVVADDEARVRGFLREVLERGGYEVIEAADGKQALKEARTGGVGLVITDLVMPKQEGIETIQAMRKEMPGIGIIAITGKFEGQYLGMIELLGADSVLTKPVSNELLLARVAAALKRLRL